MPNTCVSGCVWIVKQARQDVYGSDQAGWWRIQNDPDVLGKHPPHAGHNAHSLQCCRDPLCFTQWTMLSVATTPAKGTGSVASRFSPSPRPSTAIRIVSHCSVKRRTVLLFISLFAGVCPTGNEQESVQQSFPPPETWANEHHYAMMRNNLKPAFETEELTKACRIKLKCNKREATHIWLNFMLALIGETLPRAFAGNIL